MSVPRVSTSLVHFTHVGPTCLTSGSHLCHVSIFHWSISPALATWQNTLRFLKNTWQSLIGPHHKPLPFGSLWMVHSNKRNAKWQHQSEPPQQLSAIWHFPIGPPQPCGPHRTTRWLTSGPHLVPRGRHRLVPCHYTGPTCGLFWLVQVSIAAHMAQLIKATSAIH
jgi:hypothetical protein